MPAEGGKDVRDRDHQSRPAGRDRQRRAGGRGAGDPLTPLPRPLEPSGGAQGAGEALGRLLGLAAWLGLADEELRAHDPRPGAQAYPAFVAWLALNGSRSDVVLAFLANLATWGENCGRVAEALRARYGASDEAVSFFQFFASPPADFERRALAVLAAGLGEGESPERARRATRLLQAYELSFWDAMVEGL